MNKNAQTDKITVYYDGACPSCVRDRTTYERLAGERAKEIDWVDITSNNEGLRKVGIDPKRALLELHVLDKNEQIKKELDAYILLMKKVSLLKPLAWIIGLPLIRPVVSRFYRWQVDQRLLREGRLP